MSRLTCHRQQIGWGASLGGGGGRTGQKNARAPARGPRAVGSCFCETAGWMRRRGKGPRLPGGQSGSPGKTRRLGNGQMWRTAGPVAVWPQGGACRRKGMERVKVRKAWCLGGGPSSVGASPWQSRGGGIPGGCQAPGWECDSAAGQGLCVLSAAGATASAQGSPLRLGPPPPAFED